MHPSMLICQQCQQGFEVSKNRTSCEPSVVGNGGNNREAVAADAQTNIDNQTVCATGQFLKAMDRGCMSCDERCESGQCLDYNGCNKCEVGFYRSRPDILWPFVCRSCGEKVPSCIECVDDGLYDSQIPTCTKCSEGLVPSLYGRSCEASPGAETASKPPSESEEIITDKTTEKVVPTTSPATPEEEEVTTRKTTVVAPPDDEETSRTTFSVPAEEETSRTTFMETPTVTTTTKMTPEEEEVVTTEKTTLVGPLEEEETSRTTFIVPPQEDSSRTTFTTTSPEEEETSRTTFTTGPPVPVEEDRTTFTIPGMEKSSQTKYASTPGYPELGDGSEHRSSKCGELQYLKGQEGCVACDSYCLEGQCRDWDGCTKCQYGFYTHTSNHGSSFSCRSCKESVPHCSICKDGCFDSLPVLCLECDPGYQLSSDGLSCVSREAVFKPETSFRVYIPKIHAPW